MTYRSPSFKLGVLNMTISFDQPQTSRSAHKKKDTNSSKIHPVPRFIPRYRALCQRNMTISDRKQNGFSPYLNYRQSQKASLRYYREHQQTEKKEQTLAKLCPGSMYQDQEDPLGQNYSGDVNYIPNRPIKGTQLKMTLNKRHLRPQSQIRGEDSDDHVLFNLDRNPEENLKGVFTVRPVKTSLRYRKEYCEKTNKPARQSKTKQQHRLKAPLRAQHDYNKQKNIRPWSPLKNTFNREMMQSDLMYPHA